MKINLLLLFNLVSSAKLHDPYRLSTMTNNHSTRSLKEAIQSHRLFSLYKTSVLQCMAGYKSGCQRMQIIAKFHSQASKFNIWKTSTNHFTMPYDFKADLKLWYDAFPIKLFSYNKNLNFAVIALFWTTCSLYVETLKTTVKWSNLSLYYSQ